MQAQQQEIVVRVRSSKGFNRVSIKLTDTIAQLKQKVEQLTSIPASDMQFFYDQAFTQLLVSIDKTSIGSIPKLKNGIELFLKEKPSQSVPQKMEIEKSTHPQEKKQNETILSSLCNHSLNQRCINCLSANTAKKDEKQNQEENLKKCNHGPQGSCLNCIDTSKKEEDKHEKQKWNCQHGPNGKCSHCIDSELIQNVKHVSFTHFLEEKKSKCKGQHPIEAKCSSCLPPSEQRMKVDVSCKNHEAWPKAMCNKCLPPSCVIARQPYRHVDFAQFMNVKDVSNFVQSWVQTSHTQQKIGFLYGYYAEDPNYKGGVRAIIEAIYEPPQTGDISGFQLLYDEYENYVDQIAEALTLEKIGWVFTTINHDTFLSSHELRMAARYQEHYRVQHESGYPVSTFITVVLRTGKDNASEVRPEVYMVSDQAQCMEKNNIFGDSERRKFMKVRDPVDDNDILPAMVVGGKNVKEFEPDYFIVNVAHGHSSHNKFSIVKHADFPVANRQQQNPQEVQRYLRQFKNQKSYEKFSDFHLLLYLAKLVDLETACVIASSVAQEKEVPEGCVNLINQIVGL